MKVKIEKGVLTLEIDIEKEPKPSASGKNLIIASTKGIIVMDYAVKGRPLKVGFNAFISRG